MVRSRTLRLRTLAFGGVCLLASTGGHLVAPREAVPAGEPPAAVGLLTRAADAAVLPARVADEVRSAGQGAPLRALVLAAVLAVLVGLPAGLHRRTVAGGRDHRPLRARRHTISLRAPPLLFA